MVDEAALQVEVRNYPKPFLCRYSGYMGGRFIGLPGEICKAAAGGRSVFKGAMHGSDAVAGPTEVSPGHSTQTLGKGQASEKRRSSFETGSLVMKAENLSGDRAVLKGYGWKPEGINKR